MRFCGYHELGDRPNIVADGSPNAHTVLTLSHWPGAPTPPALAADTSSEIVFRYLDDRAAYPAAELVSNNHFDEDGLVSMFALVEPDAAQARRALLVDAATAGDFGTFRSRDGARVAMTIAAFADEATSPLDAAVFALGHAEQTARLYHELIPRLSEICDRLDVFEALWRPRDARLDAGLAALRDGIVTVDERPDLDLAVVRFTDGRPFGELDELALHRATDRFRLLLISGRRYELVYRYESWLRFQSRRPLPRVDLAPLAARLDELEGRHRWRADAVGSITPRLQLADAADSAIDVVNLVAAVEAHLASAPPAWFPYG